jgi:hypothetical protein
MESDIIGILQDIVSIGSLPYVTILYLILICKLKGILIDRIAMLILSLYFVVFITRFAYSQTHKSNESTNITYIISYGCETIIWCGFYILVFTMERVRMVVTA